MNRVRRVDAARMSRHSRSDDELRVRRAACAARCATGNGSTRRDHRCRTTSNTGRTADRRAAHPGVAFRARRERSCVRNPVRDRNRRHAALATVVRARSAVETVDENIDGDLSGTAERARIEVRHTRSGTSPARCSIPCRRGVPTSTRPVHHEHMHDEHFSRARHGPDATHRRPDLPTPIAAAVAAAGDVAHRLDIERRWTTRARQSAMSGNRQRLRARSGDDTWHAGRTSFPSKSSSRRGRTACASWC